MLELVCFDKSHFAFLRLYKIWIGVTTFCGKIRTNTRDLIHQFNFKPNDASLSEEETKRIISENIAYLTGRESRFCHNGRDKNVGYLSILAYPKLIYSTE